MSNSFFSAPHKSHLRYDKTAHFRANPGVLIVEFGNPANPNLWINSNPWESRVKSASQLGLSHNCLFMYAFFFVCCERILRVWPCLAAASEGSLLSILTNDQCQVEGEGSTKELDSQRKWTKFNFSLGCASCQPHKAKTYYEMATNVIIIQAWWGAPPTRFNWTFQFSSPNNKNGWFAAVFCPQFKTCSGWLNWEFTDSLVCVCECVRARVHADGGYWFI